MKNKEEKLMYYTYGLDIVFLNIFSIVLFVVVWGLVIFFCRGEYVWSNEDSGFLFIYMILWLMLHEILHGIGFSLFPEVKKKNICFGMALEKGVFYCMCKQKISKKVILTSLLFPFTLIGVVTLVWGIIIHSYILVMLSILNIAGAVGDLAMTYYFLKVPNDVIYLDLDDCTSFTVLSKHDLSKVKSRGVILKESGIYHSDMVHKDSRKLVISKTSYVVLGIVVLLSIVMILMRR